MIFISSISACAVRFSPEVKIYGLDSVASYNKANIRHRKIIPLKKLFPSSEIERLRKDGFLSEYNYMEQYRKHIEGYDFTTYFWRKYGLSRDEHITIIAQSSVAEEFFATRVIESRLKALGYLCRKVFGERIEKVKAE